nr:erythrocyte band 7 integral membrane protein [Macaca nemestrina]
MAEKRHTADSEAQRLPDSFKGEPRTGVTIEGWRGANGTFPIARARVISRPPDARPHASAALSRVTHADEDTQRELAARTLSSPTLTPTLPSQSSRQKLQVAQSPSPVEKLIIKEYERAIIFRLGRILQGGAKGPGLFFILPCTDSFIKVDMRTISFDIPPQEILTKDSVTISVDGVVYYRVQNATLAVANITNADSATRLLAQTTLRNVLGTKNLSQILSDREEIAHNMQSTLDDATDAWGIKVERVEIKDVKLPVQLQRAMAAEAEASREARAKVIAAEGEMNASRALKEASMVITESPAALQLRYLQTLTTIAAEKNSTIVFPLPIDMLQGIIGAKHGHLG